MPMLKCGEKLLAVRCQICKIAIVIRNIKSGLSGYYLRTEVLEGLGRILAFQLHVLMVGDTQPLQALQGIAPCIACPQAVGSP